MSSTKQVVSLHYEQIVARAASAMSNVPLPNEGWLRTLRKALHMSGAQLARRLGVTRALIAQTEKAELTGSVTIKKMQEIAEAMDCRFVYAVLPKTSVQEIITTQATKKAKAYVDKTSKHMALEDQSLDRNQIEFELRRLAQEMSKTPPRDLWDDE